MKSTPGNGNATEKVLAVLQALAESDRIADIAAGTGLPRSTVHRILQSLVDHRFALNSGDGRYIGGPRILTLAGRLMARFDPAQHADGTLRQLREDTGYTVHFGLLAGDDVVYAAKVEGKKPYRMPSSVGLSVRLHTTAIGKAILATLSDEAVSTIMERRGMEARTPGTITTVPALLGHLASIRARGYALDEEENEPGIRCIGAAVYDHTGRAAGAVSISTLVLEPWDRPMDELAARVRASAREISESLGHLPERRD
ncbi:IclR family transcriptional regulator [Actinoplanes subtropicus]|uniref:IclR family transcriptional regulator n=1 Tax=Actinoplanes subtropicus TaxID=543632 RepID=UPI0004C3D9A5|nr:IclR family transcriptional regulator [Actinoplanes subtropicus]